MAITIGQVIVVPRAKDFVSTSSDLKLFIATDTLRYRVVDSTGMLFDSLISRPENITSTAGTVVLTIAGDEFTFDTSSVTGTDAGWSIEAHFAKRNTTITEASTGEVGIVIDTHNYIAELLDACHPFNEWNAYSELHPNRTLAHFMKTEESRLVTELVPMLSSGNKIDGGAMTALPTNGKFQNYITGNYEYPVDGQVYVSPNQDGPIPVKRFYFNASNSTGVSWSKFIPAPVVINEIVAHSVRKKVVGESYYRFWATANNARYWYFTGDQDKLRLDMGSQITHVKGWVDFI